jgi:hypothetical protein
LQSSATAPKIRSIHIVASTCQRRALVTVLLPGLLSLPIFRNPLQVLLRSLKFLCPTRINPSPRFLAFQRVLDVLEIRVTTSCPLNCLSAGREQQQDTIHLILTLPLRLFQLCLLI